VAENSEAVPREAVLADLRARGVEVSVRYSFRRRSPTPPTAWAGLDEDD
jgi:hypothetical protein